MSINLRDLKYFEVAAEMQSIGKAAEKLGRTQPAITKAVHRLEEAFESALFERQGRRVQLTAVGEVLLARARMLRGATEEAYREVEDYARGNAGHVRIGSGPIAADQVLPQLCSLLLKEAHQTTVAITVGPSLLLRDRLREGALDLLIGLMPEHDEDVHSHAIVQDVVVVAAAKNHPVFDESDLSMQSLLKWNWALPQDSVPSRQWLDNRFQSLGLERPKVQISANSIPHLPRLIAKTQLLSFLSRRTLAESRSKQLLREVPLQEAQLSRALGVSYRKDGYLSPAAQRLLQLLHVHGESLFGDETLTDW